MTGDEPDHRIDNGLGIDRVDWIRDGTIASLVYPRATAAEFGAAPAAHDRQVRIDRRADGDAPGKQLILGVRATGGWGAAGLLGGL